MIDMVLLLVVFYPGVFRGGGRWAAGAVSLRERADGRRGLDGNSGGTEIGRYVTGLFPKGPSARAVGLLAVPGPAGRTGAIDHQDVLG
ncbi:hypothetical protein [Streptomyces somaliensis]|uniref:hypothetical protein n=1 Tax=Streptomyces somaliensis TaxID=78355 RepID=UPI0034E948EC|nr:hypothetical protein [Streptomyces somaliensis]